MLFYLLENNARQLRARNGTILNHHHLKVMTCRKCQILIRYSPIKKKKQNGVGILLQSILGLVLHVLRQTLICTCGIILP